MSEKSQVCQPTYLLSDFCYIALFSRQKSVIASVRTPEAKREHMDRESYKHPQLIKKLDGQLVQYSIIFHLSVQHANKLQIEINEKLIADSRKDVILRIPVGFPSEELLSLRLQQLPFQLLQLCPPGKKSPS